MNEKNVKVHVFCCATSYDQNRVKKEASTPNMELKVISLPCSGKLDILYLIKAFETGADGVAVMVCKNSECRYLEGNMRAGKRAEAVAELLEETGYGKDRLALIQMGNGGFEQALHQLRDFCTGIAIRGENRSAASRVLTPVSL